MAQKSKLLTILITAVVSALFTTFIVGSVGFGTWYFQNLKIKKLQNDNKEIRLEIKRLNNKDKKSISDKDNYNDWLFYKNYRFVYVVRYPSGWKKTESQNGDGMTLRKGAQKILVYGTTNYQDYKNINSHLKTDYANRIKSKTSFTADNVNGFHVKTDMEEFIIFMSNDNFVYIYTDLPAKSTTLDVVEKIGKSFQDLSE